MGVSGSIQSLIEAALVKHDNNMELFPTDGWLITTALIIQTI